MSKFTLICEDEALPFYGASRLSHDFETEDLGYIISSMTKFLQCAGYLGNDKVLELGRVIDLGDLDPWSKNNE